MQNAPGGTGHKGGDGGAAPVAASAGDCCTYSSGMHGRALGPNLAISAMPSRPSRRMLNRERVREEMIKGRNDTGKAGMPNPSVSIPVACPAYIFRTRKQKQTQA
eukprot:1159281-Pelagomonas_calceolata.AAC.5